MSCLEFYCISASLRLTLHDTLSTCIFNGETLSIQLHQIFICAYYPALQGIARANATLMEASFIASLGLLWGIILLSQLV